LTVPLTLLLGSLAARLVGRLGVDCVDSWPAAIAVGLAVMFVMTGVAHFVGPMRADMIAIVPPRLPAPALLVAAAVCLLLLMLAMFPANVYAVRMPDPPKSMTSRLWVRSGQEIVYLAAAVVVAVCGG
jgi:uncharacterized membrane protein